MRYPQAIQNLIEYFQKLPSVGPKTAERYVFYLLKKSPETLQGFAQSLAQLKLGTKMCQSCLAISDANPCPICQDDKRNKAILCIVANTQEMLSLEATGKYPGKYFVLGGLVDSLENIGPEQLNVKALIKKIQAEDIKEIILALSPTVEGETTVLYLSKLLKPENIKITRLARGLPLGSSLEYTDEITLIESLKNRSQI